jgi:hypothetical protein
LRKKLRLRRRADFEKPQQRQRKISDEKKKLETAGDEEEKEVCLCPWQVCSVRTNEFPEHSQTWSLGES